MAEPQNTRTRTRSYSRMHPAPNLGARRVRKIGLAVGAVLALGACTGQSDAASVPTVHLEPTTSTTAAPTITTTEAVTTTEDPAVAYERDVAEITTVYDQLRSYYDVHGVVANRVDMEEFATDPLLATMFENVTAWEQQGFLAGEVVHEFEIVELVVDGDHASLTSCNLDGGSLVTADGQVIIPADTEWHLRVADLVRSSNGWKVAATSDANGEVTICEVS